MSKRKQGWPDPAADGTPWTQVWRCHTCDESFEITSPNNVLVGALHHCGGNCQRETVGGIDAAD